MERWKDLTREAERSFGVVTRDQLSGVGLSSRTIDRWSAEGRLVPMAHGVFRLGGVPPSFEADVVAALRVFDGDTWGSHHTAARLLALGVSGREHRIELTRPYGLSAKRSVARVHRTTHLPPHHLTNVGGIPITTASRTLFDLARTTGPTRLGRAVDAALLQRTATMGSLYRVLHDLGGRGRPGTRRMREVLDTRGLDHVPPESELEEVGMALLAGLGFAWQVEMSDAQGYIRRVDALHRAGGLVLELDGSQHDAPPQRALDLQGDRRLEALGLEVVRLRWVHVTRGSDATRAGLLRRVRSAAA